MRQKQIASMSKEELTKKLSELRKELINLNTQSASGSNVKSPALIKNTKKTIARILNKLNNKEE